MRNFKEVAVLSKDFFKFVIGRDYSRQSQPLGKYFRDPRCYYNDLRGKADWQGAFIDGVPAVRMASSGRTFWFPIDIFLYALGNVDRYIYDYDRQARAKVERVARWMLTQMSSSGAFDHKWKEMEPQQEFYSSNSAMGQGLALSFAIRVVKYRLCKDPVVLQQLQEAIIRIKDNMLTPVQQGGCFLENGKGIFFMEFPRKDGNIVLNGWIFAVFGLYDFMNYQNDATVERTFRRTITTLEGVLPEFHLPSGWALYDNMGRVCSPFYQDLQAALLEALYLITGSAVIGKYLELSQQANTAVNRLYFAGNKIVQKLFVDKEAYISV